MGRIAASDETGADANREFSIREVVSNLDLSARIIYTGTMGTPQSWVCHETTRFYCCSRSITLEGLLVGDVITILGFSHEGIHHVKSVRLHLPLLREWPGRLARSADSLRLRQAA